LKSDPSIIIIPADKGNKTIVLDRDSYLQKLQERIAPHTPLSKDPTRQKEIAINKALTEIADSPTPPKPKTNTKESISHS
jgi:hypothetical protein